MSDLLGIRDKLADTGAMIALLERELASRPSDKSITINLTSLENRRRQLEAAFAEVSSDMGQDICRYRFLTNGEPAKIAGLANSLLDYQSLVSVLFDAIKTNSPRQTSKISTETLEKTAFDFGYTFAGSIGFALTVPNARLHGLETTLDEAFRLISELVKAAKPDDIREHARRVGRAPIRLLYQWAINHLKSHLSAEVEWGRGARVQARFLVQMPEFKALTEAIAQTSDEERNEIIVTGTIQGVDAATKTFHLEPDSGGDIRGTLAHTIDPSHTVEVPKRYTAKMTRIRVIYYSTEEEKDRFELTNLEPV
jgi:hypothetical protein